MIRTLRGKHFNQRTVGDLVNLLARWCALDDDMRVTVTLLREHVLWIVWIFGVPAILGVATLGSWKCSLGHRLPASLV